MVFEGRGDPKAKATSSPRPSVRNRTSDWTQVLGLVSMDQKIQATNFGASLRDGVSFSSLFPSYGGISQVTVNFLKIRKRPYNFINTFRVKSQHSTRFKTPILLECDCDRFNMGSREGFGVNAQGRGPKVPPDIAKPRGLEKRPLHVRVPGSYGVLSYSQVQYQYLQGPMRS